MLVVNEFGEIGPRHGYGRVVVFMANTGYGAVLCYVSMACCPGKFHRLCVVGRPVVPLNLRLLGIIRWLPVGNSHSSSLVRRVLVQPQEKDAPAGLRPTRCLEAYNRRRVLAKRCC